MTASQTTKPTSIPRPDRAFFRGIFASYRRLLVFVKPYWQRLALAGVIVTVNSLLGLVLPLVIRGIIDSALVVANQQLLNRVTLLLLAIFVIQAFLGFGQIYLLSWVGERVVANLRKALYGHLQSMPLRFFAGTRIGELISRLGTDVMTIQDAVTTTLLNLVSQTITLVGGLIIIFVMSWRLTLMMLAIVPIAVIGMILLGRWVRKISRQAQDALAETSATAEEALGGIRIVKSFATRTVRDQPLWRGGRAAFRH